MFNRAKARAKQRDIEFNLQPYDITIPTHCSVFGFQLETGGSSDTSPALDRIHNNIGYVKGNVIVVSGRANRLKSDATLPELERILEFYSDLE